MGSPKTDGDHLIKDNSFLSLCRFKGLWTVTAQIVFDWMIGLRTVGESCPLDSPCCDYIHHPFMINNCTQQSAHNLVNIQHL